MNNNIMIADTSYSEYKTEKKFTTPLAKKVLSNSKVIERTIFVIGESSKKNLITETINIAKKSGYKVYALEKEKEYLNDEDINYVKENTEKYFNALYCSQIIYTSQYIHHNYIKQDNQIVVFNPIDLDRKEVADRSTYSIVANRSDWIISDTDEKGSISGKTYLNRLQNGELKNNIISTQKKKLLFLINIKQFDSLFGTFFNLSCNLDFSKYDVTVFILSKYEAEYSKYLKNLDPHINIIIRKGGLLCDDETARKISYLETVDDYIYNLSKIEKFINVNIIQDEIRRIFGQEQFDYIFNMKFDSIYWKLLINQMSGKKIYLDINNYNKTKSNQCLAKKKYIKTYDKVLYLNKDSYLNNSHSFERYTGFKKVIPFTQTRKNICEDKFVKGNFLGEECVVVPLNKSVDFDVYRVGMFEVDKMAYVVLDPFMTNDDAKKLIEKNLDGEKKVFIFDFYNIINNRDVVTMDYSDTVYIIKEYIVFDGLRDYLKNEINVDRKNVISIDNDIISYIS